MSIVLESKWIEFMFWGWIIGNERIETNQGGGKMTKKHNDNDIALVFQRLWDWSVQSVMPEKVVQLVKVSKQLNQIIIFVDGDNHFVGSFTGHH